MVDITNFCYGAAGILQLIGWVLTIFKIAIPLLIIIYGVLDFGKTVTAAKDDEIKKSVKSLMWRAVAGIAIFFIPTFVMWLFRAVGSYKNMESGVNFRNFEDFLLRPFRCYTSQS